MVHFPEFTSHCLHPHTLKREGIPNAEFTCNGCNSFGSGFRYRCSVNTSSECNNFNLHEFCATCQSSLESFMHTKHSLKLHTPRDNHKSTCFAWLTRSLNKPIRHPGTEERSLACELCRLPINDKSEIFYTCKRCEFYVHPLCSQMPELTNHRRHGHNDHQLTLGKPDVDRDCVVCRRVCRGWRYLCEREQCKVDIHINCIASDINRDGRSVRSIFDILRHLGVIVIKAVTIASAVAQIL